MLASSTPSNIISVRKSYRGRNMLPFKSYTFYFSCVYERYLALLRRNRRIRVCGEEAAFTKSTLMKLCLNAKG